MVKPDAKEPTATLMLEQVSIDDLTPDRANPRRIPEPSWRLSPGASLSSAWSIPSSHEPRTRP